jgi:hypothetical protein
LVRSAVGPSLARSYYDEGNPLIWHPTVNVPVIENAF